MLSGRLAALALIAALAAPAPASADGRPSGESLWQAYPLQPTVTATAARTPVRQRTRFGTSEPVIVLHVRRHSPPAKPSGGGGVPLLPLGLAALGAGGLAVFLLARRRRPPRPPAS